MAQLERSAGVIIYRTDPPTGGRMFLLLDYGRHWEFPKGHVEKGEGDAAAAIRELREETGITDVQLDPTFKREITYFFRAKKGGVIRKTVMFFLGQTHTADVQLSHEHVGYIYLPFNQALRKVTYANARELLKRAGEHLGEHEPVEAGDKVS
jgi:bis(5'-nucleosidyl)-tetraphosphatase